MIGLPHKLTRKALKRCFDNVSEKTWDYYYDHEKENGLAEFLISNGHRIVVYDSKGVIQWLISKGHYAPNEFQNQPKLSRHWADLNIHTHILAG